MESTYQRRLKKHFEGKGWLVIKIIRATVNGYPDLILLHPNRPTIFIEVKNTGGKLSPVQEYRIKELNERGFIALVSYPEDYAQTVAYLESF
jgi:Holliday junction resolvase